MWIFPRTCQPGSILVPSIFSPGNSCSCAASPWDTSTGARRRVRGSIQLAPGRWFSLFSACFSFCATRASFWARGLSTSGPRFALFAYLLAQVFICYGPLLEKTLLHRYLRFLGQHSLQVFAWSILVCYAVPYPYQRLGVMGSRGAQIALALIGVASLVIPARLHAIYRERLRVRAAPPPVELSQRPA